MKHFSATTCLRIIAGALLFSSVSGCKKLDPEEAIPSYVHIDAIPLVITNPALQGSSSNKITDAWIYVDNEVLGAYELPCTIPIIAEGNHHILVRAGVKMNGSTVLRAIYPYYKGWEADVSLVPGGTVNLSPEVQYFPGIDFSTTFKENFDQTGVSLVPDANISATIDVEPGFEGNSGVIRLNSTDTIEFIARTSTTYTLTANTEVWLEMDYKCNDVITIGIASADGLYVSAAANVYPNESWSKIYIRLNDAISAVQQITGSSDPRKIYIAFRHSTGSPERPYLAIDNLKLVK